MQKLIFVQSFSHEQKYPNLCIGFLLCSLCPRETIARSRELKLHNWLLPITEPKTIPNLLLLPKDWKIPWRIRPMGHRRARLQRAGRGVSEPRHAMREEHRASSSEQIPTVILPKHNAPNCAAAVFIRTRPHRLKQNVRSWRLHDPRLWLLYARRLDCASGILAS